MRATLLISILLLAADASAQPPELPHAPPPVAPRQIIRADHSDSIDRPTPADITLPPQAATLAPAESIRLSPRSGRTADEGSTPSAWGTLGALVLVIGSFLIAARLWKKHGPRVARGLPKEVFEHLGKRPLDQRHAVEIVRLGNRILVLGSSAAGLVTLAEITDPIEVDMLSGLCRKRDDEGGHVNSFISLFERRTANGDGSRRGPTMERAAAEIPEQRLTDQLRSLANRRVPAEASHV